MDFNLNVNVQIGVTPELAMLIGATLDKRTCQKQMQSQPLMVAPIAAESDKPQKPKDAPELSGQEAAPVEADSNAAVEEVPEAVAAAAAAPKPLTEEDIRAAMHRTRQRFEGEDYKENTDSEAYKKYHKQLTSMFKQIAAVLGADKPSALPADRRAAFIAECDALIIGDDGNVTPPPAPY